jgi:hypothetical protein
LGDKLPAGLNWLRQNTFGNAIGSSLAERLDPESELNSVRSQSTVRARQRGDAMPLLQSLGTERLPSAELLENLNHPAFVTDEDVEVMQRVMADSIEVAGAGGGVSAVQARDARLRQLQQNAMYGISDDGVMNRLISPNRDTGQRLVPTTGDGLSAAARYLRDNGYLDPREGQVSYDVGRHLIEDIGVVGAPEAALGLIPTKVTAAANRYITAAGEFVLGEQRAAKFALNAELRNGLALGELGLASDLRYAENSLATGPITARETRIEGYHFFREVELVNAKGSPLAELDDVDVFRRVIYEDKEALGFGRALKPNLSDAARERALTREIEKFVDNKVIAKAEAKIDALSTAAYTRPNPSGNGTAFVPSLQEISEIRNMTFRFEGDSPVLQRVMQARLQTLQVRYPEYNFSSQYGYKPLTKPVR